MGDVNQAIKRAAEFHRSGDLHRAETGYLDVLKLDPLHPDALHLLGCIASSRGDYNRAVQLIQQAIAQFPNSDIFYNNMGNALARLNRKSEALDAYQSALRINPNAIDAMNNLATTLMEVGRVKMSLEYFKKALQKKPDAVEVYNNMGNALTLLGKYDTAIDVFKEAIRLRPDYAVAFNNLGSAFKACEKYHEAVESYRRSIAANPQYAEAINNLGETLADMGKPDEAIPFFQKAIALKSDFYLAVSNLLYASIRTCNWEASQELNRVLDNASQIALQEHRRPPEDPFLNLVRHDKPALNYKVAAAWSVAVENRMGGRQHGYHFGERPKGERKLVIGYLSHNFHDHPMTHLMLRLLAVHNRNTVEVQCFSTGRDDKSDYRHRITQAADKFVDIRDMSHGEAADCIYANKVDILVDLMGHTKGNRLDVCAIRPAPIQVRYLGMAGTTGSSFIDYLIADPEVVPKAHFPYYSEKIVHLAHCYQVNDNQQSASSRIFKRHEAGLPDDAVVYCSFNQPYKIDPVIFDAWMKILRSVPQSVLWLQGGNALAERNLRHHAETSGVDSSRIIYAARMSKTDHLARLRLADIALDTRMVSGAATTSDALWAGVPVVSLKGAHFSSRMSASIVSAAGLGELALDRLDDYCAAAIALAQDADLLASKKDYLKKHLLASPLFDTNGFALGLETAYNRMWQRFCSGDTPAHFYI